MKALITFILLVLSTIQLFAQDSTGTVLGSVVDENNLGIYSVHVFIEDNGAKYQAKTDFDGRFRMYNIPTGTYILNVRLFEDTLSNIIVNVPKDGLVNVGEIVFIQSVKEISKHKLTYCPPLKPQELTRHKSSYCPPLKPQGLTKHQVDEINGISKDLILKNGSSAN